MAEYISYLRVSTQRQGLSGLGVEAQRSAVDDFLKRVDGTLLEEFVEIESGARKSRPILVQSIAQSRKAGAVLLIAKLDRLARNVAFVSSLMESGVEFVAADAPYANRLMIHILSAFAEHERTLISERTKAALAAAKIRGVKLGQNGKVLGARNRLVADAFAASLSGAVENANAAGAKTLLQLANGMNAEGFRTRQGHLWTPGTVHRLLARLGRTAGSKAH